jgi:hypothetical protein
MKTIKFSETEIDLLKQIYSEELELAENYVRQIKEVLKKLGVVSEPSPEKPGEKEAKPGKKRGRKPKVSAVPAIIESLIAAKQPRKLKEKKVAEPKKRGRKKSVPAVEPAPAAIATPVRKDKKIKALPKPKKEKAVKAKIEKNPAVKRIIKPKAVVKPEPVANSVPAETKEAPKKKIKKVAKKKPTRKRKAGGKVTLTRLGKPIPKKEPVPEPVVEIPAAGENPPPAGDAQE